MWKDEALFGPVLRPCQVRETRIGGWQKSHRIDKGLNPRGDNERGDMAHVRKVLQVFSKYIRPQAMAAVGSKQLGPVFRTFAALEALRGRRAGAKKAKDSTMSVDIDTE